MQVSSMRLCLRVCVKTILVIGKAYRYILRTAHRILFVRCGRNVVFDPSSSYFSYENIEIGNDVFVGGRAWWAASHSKIIIGNYVMFGPDVRIIAGDHASDRVDIPMFLQKKEDALRLIDADVRIEDDVWIGAGVTILKGVVVGRGAIVGAGSVVVKSVEPYTVVGGVPCRKIRNRI
jgi:chloramphenicol O-acetyltransferase type B